MSLENKLGITDQVALAKAEERLSKQRAKQLFDLGAMAYIEVGTFAGLASIHAPGCFKTFTTSQVKYAR